MVAVAERRPLARADGAPTAPATLIDWYLAEQQELTAVERFAQRHEALEEPLMERYYSALLPAAPPGPGEQYAFEVDLDACSGCKACVAACHSLNGLDDDETWRDVGLLHGGSDEQPFLQHVTTACHHCLDPACLNVCPVRAYEKEAATGIVRHLDDQCIGCQYCVLACPYDVPKYNRARGIVRKCDLCSNRLAVGEAPACVQSCPNGAIRVTTVSLREAAANCETGAFLPGAPDPQHTQPTTHYKTGRVFPRNTLPADYYSVDPAHAHWPLVFMLVLTQLSVGAFLVEAIVELLSDARVLHGVRAAHAVGSLLFGLVALGASTLHLGRPHLAYRAIVGLTSSWLSREILAFGLFALLAMAYALSLWSARLPVPGATRLQTGLDVAVVATGLAGVFCSIMIYHCTRRPLWNGAPTAVRFLLTTVILGLSTALVTARMATGISAVPPVVGSLRDPISAILISLLTAAGLKLSFEAALFCHLRSKQNTPLKRSARLMAGELAAAAKWRFALGAFGGLMLPLLWLNSEIDVLAPGPAVSLLVVVQFAALLAGELLERYLFFTAVAASRMPGGLRT